MTVLPSLTFLRLDRFVIFRAGLLIAAFAGSVTCAEGASVGRFVVSDYGATGDGQTLDTAAINRTIAAAVAAGGGKVELPSGQLSLPTVTSRQTFKS